MAGEKKHKKKLWNFQINLGPLSIILWGIGILFFLAWIFVLGIFVGRGFLPSEITDISELKGEINKIQQAIEPEDTPESDMTTSADLKETEPELVFYDKLTTKKDEAKNNLYTEPNEEINKTVSKPIKPAEVQISGSDVKDVKPAAGSTSRSSGPGQFTIQVASIAELASAEKTVRQLIEKGFDAYYYDTIIKGKKYYRVRCGKFSDRAEAQKYSLRLKEKTGLKGYVTDTE